MLVNRFRTRLGHTETGHHLGKNDMVFPQTGRHVRAGPVRVEGIPHPAIEVPPRGTRMTYSERTAGDDTLYSFSSTIEYRPLLTSRKGILWWYMQEGIEESQTIIPILVILALAAGFIL